MKAPLVSIISGYYNRENHIHDSVLSLVNQSYSNIEIIIFDDCSTDNTYVELKNIAKIDDRIKLIRHKKNIGFVNGLINSISKSKGEYIAIHGSGDYSYETRIEKQVDILNNCPNIGAVGCYVENIKKINNCSKTELMKIPLKGDITNKLKSTNIFTHGEVMFRKSLYEKVGGYRNYFVYSQDYDLWARMSVYCHFANVKEVLYKRYLLNDGASVHPQKRLCQALMAKLVQQNLTYILANKPDLVDKFPNNAISQIPFLNSKDTVYIFNRFIEAFRSTDKNSELLRSSLDLIVNKTNKIIYPLIFRFFFSILPQKISISLIKINIINRILKASIYRLP